MCPSERYTQRRGRSVVPVTLVRTRSWTRRRCASFEMLRTLAVATLFLLYSLAALRRPHERRVSRPATTLRAAGLRSGLAGFLLQALAGDTHTLLLVRVGWTQRASVCCYLTNLAFIRAAYDQVRLLLDGDLDAFGNVKLDRVRLAERECHHLAFEFRAVADADDVEVPLEASGDAGNRVGHQRAGQAVQRAMLLGGAQGVQHAVLLLEGDAVRKRNRQLALGALHFDTIALQRDSYAAGQWNRFASDT